MAIRDVAWLLLPYKVVAVRLYAALQADHKLPRVIWHRRPVISPLINGLRCLIRWRGIPGATVVWVSVHIAQYRVGFLAGANLADALVSGKILVLVKQAVRWTVPWRAVVLDPVSVVLHVEEVDVACYSPVACSLRGVTPYNARSAAGAYGASHWRVGYVRRKSVLINFKATRSLVFVSLRAMKDSIIVCQRVVPENKPAAPVGINSRTSALAVVLERAILNVYGLIGSEIGRVVPASVS